jgi:cyanophycinase
MSKFFNILGLSLVTLALVGSHTPTHCRSAEGEPCGWANRAAAARPGALVLVGGGTLPDSIRQYFLQLAGGSKARLVIIPSASSEPNAAAQCYDFWKTAPVESVRILDTNNRADADDPRFYETLREATGVWISGGDQNRLADLFGGTGVERELKALVGRGGVVGGTSAGASIASGVMMTGNEKTGRGFGLVTGTVVDQHFSNRGRLPRLLAALRSNPDQLGIGIDESTAVVFRAGEISVLGEATVTVARTGAKPSVQVYRAGGHFPQPETLSVALN